MPYNYNVPVRKENACNPTANVGMYNLLYESPILGQLLDLISRAKINLFDFRFKSYDPYDMEN